MSLHVGDIFRNAARAVPEQTAASLGADRLSFRDLDRRANQAARALSALGVRRGERVATWCPTSLEVIALFAGAAKLGAILVPLNSVLGVEELAAMVSAAKPALLVATDDRPGPAGAVGGRLGVAVATLEGLIALARKQTSGDVRPAGLSERDPHVVFFTSGSTGHPKGVVLSHRVNMLRTHPGAQLEPRGAMVCPYPLFHMGAWTIAMQQWQARDEIVVLSTADASGIVDAVERHRAERLNCIPAVWRRVIDEVDAGGRSGALASLRFADTGTSSTPPDLLEAIRRVAPHACLRVFYGSSEAGNVCALTGDDVFRKPGSCGIPNHSIEVRVDGHGELCVRGPVVFDGYFDDPAATSAALVDGWYRTGDLATVDEDGYLSIVGRAGETIRTGGESVAPTEVEAILAAHPAIAEVAVIGVPDDRWGEVVCAVVVPSGDEPGGPTVEELRRFCQGRLASFKQPRRVVTAEALPRTASTGQVQRVLIAQRLRTQEGP